MTEPKRRPGRPATGQTPSQSVRCPDGVWNAAKEKAQREGEPFAAVVERLLIAYAAESASRAAELPA